MRYTRSIVMFSGIALLIGAAAVVGQHQPMTGEQMDREKMEANFFTPDKIEWKPGPPSLPPGAMIAVLEGDPTKEGPFVFRLKMPDGYRIPPHTHPKVERVTVLSGTFHLGMGETFDRSNVAVLPAGSYGYWQPGMPHYAWVRGETIIQLHGIGPWTIEYLDPEDDPRNREGRRR